MLLTPSLPLRVYVLYGWSLNQLGCYTFICYIYKKNAHIYIWLKNT